MKTIFLAGQADWQIEVKENCDYILLPTLKEHKVSLLMTKKNVSCQLICIKRLEDKEQLKIETEVRHLSEKTKCQTTVYVALQKKANLDYLGQIIIEQKAKETDSFLTQKNLILDPTAKSSSQPILEINNNDVKASHSSSTGQLNEAELFYLTSRGLDRQLAKEILLTAFFTDALKLIHDRESREKTKKFIKIKDYEQAQY